MDEADVDTEVVCLSHRTSSHIHDSCTRRKCPASKSEFSYDDVMLRMERDDMITADGQLVTLVNHRKSCIRLLLYESSTSTIGIWSSAVTNKLS